MSHWEKSKGASDEWYTPANNFEALGERFNLDVAHPAVTHPITPCGVWYDDHGLYRDWIGFVWMNPPFGGRNSLERWLRRFFDHGNGIALTPDRTSAPWFREAWGRADLALFTPKVRFIRPNGSTGDSPSNGTTLWASGARAVEALRRARSLGILAKPERL